MMAAACVKLLLLDAGCVKILLLATMAIAALHFAAAHERTGSAPRMDRTEGAPTTKKSSDEQEEADELGKLNGQDGDTAHDVECRDVVLKPGGCQDVFNTVSGGDVMTACTNKRVQHICRRSCELCGTKIEPIMAKEEECEDQITPDSCSIGIRKIGNYFNYGNPCVQSPHVKANCARTCGFSCPGEQPRTYCEDTMEETCKHLIEQEHITCDHKWVKPLCLVSCGLCDEKVECGDVIIKEGGCHEIFTAFSNEGIGQTDACSIEKVHKICQKSCGLCESSTKPDQANPSANCSDATSAICKQRPTGLTVADMCRASTFTVDCPETCGLC